MLREQNVKIVASEPFEWNAGDLRGVIISDESIHFSTSSYCTVD